MHILLIAFGGMFGCIARYLVSTNTYKILGTNFPYGTLVVNALGSYIIGFLFIYLLDYAGSSASNLRALLIIGFLGGFTTFSSFSLETINLIEKGDIIAACLNIILSIVVCLTLTWFGIKTGRAL